ncbi:MAG: hypothetical protein C0484_07020 [Rhodospirillum sp.]|nr:hypothetical protein [Rhodospirillum sp.]
MASSPSPPFRVSSPAPPISVSSPFSSWRKSLPAPPSSLFVPNPPKISLSRAFPVPSTSSPVSRTSFSRFAPSV